MAASVKLYGSEYTYTVSNITNTITCTPSNINSRYGTVYVKPTVTQNKKGAHTRYIFIGPDVDATDYFGFPTGCFVIYKAVFSASSTTATVTEVNRSGVVLPLGRIAQGLAYRGKANWSDTYGVGLQVSISTSSSRDDEFDWKYARLTLSASGWNPSAPSISPTLSPDGLDVSVFGYVQGFCSAQWTASGGRNWSGTSNGFSYNVNPTNTLSVSANGASTSNSGTGSRTATLAYKTLSTTSVTGTAKITNNIGGSATSTATVNVQSYSKPIAKSLAIGRVKQNNEDRATMSIGWAVDILNKQSNVTQSIESGDISCTWECEDLSNPDTVFSSGTFNIINDSEAMTETTDTTPPIVLVDASGNNHNDYDPDKSFKFTAYITDRIGESSLSITAVLASEFYLICAREGGRGIGFGIVPPDDEMYVNMPANFYDNVEMNGDGVAIGTTATDGEFLVSNDMHPTLKSTMAQMSTANLANTWDAMVEDAPHGRNNVAFGIGLDGNNKGIWCSRYNGKAGHWLINENETGDALIQGKKIRNSVRVWSGAIWPTASQGGMTWTDDGLWASVTAVFSAYESGKAQNYAWHCYTVSRSFIAAHPGEGHSILLINSRLALFGTKYVYFSLDHISGNDHNDDGQYTARGMTAANNTFVLREIWLNY